jgi:hypothetical protein
MSGCHRTFKNFESLSNGEVLKIPLGAGTPSLPTPKSVRNVWHLEKFQVIQIGRRCGTEKLL